MYNRLLHNRYARATDYDTTHNIRTQQLLLKQYKLCDAKQNTYNAIFYSF